MRKHLTLIAGLLIVFGLSSCTKEYYSPTSRTFRYEISPNQWVRPNGVSNRIAVDIDLPELTDYYVDQGIVNVSASFDNDQSYDILSTTFDGVSYSVNYTTGVVTIYAEDPIIDPDVVVAIPSQTIIVKVTLSDADLIP